MLDQHEIIEDALTAVTKLRILLAKQKQPQVRASEVRSLVKATAVTWLKQHRPLLRDLDSPLLLRLDEGHRQLLDSSARATAKARYLTILDDLKASLIGIRPAAVQLASQLTRTPNFEPSPNFARLVPDHAMRLVLERRWLEGQQCMLANAHLAATVMMGSLLEALLLARFNALGDKTPIFTASAAPKDRAGKTLTLREWTLKDYIDVAHELGWIKRAARDVGTVLRDYRNYIHPAKEYAHNMVLNADDTAMFWVILRELVRQLV